MRETSGRELNSVTIQEVELDHAFAEHLEATPAFQTWLLSKTRFRRFAPEAILLAEEQAAARKAKHWWKHWWLRCADGTESETDIFAVFENSTKARFALHIENKPPHGKLLIKQAADYRKRAIQMAGKDKFLRYEDFATILLAPESFIRQHSECADQFDTHVTYEELADVIPLYADSLNLKIGRVPLQI